MSDGSSVEGAVDEGARVRFIIYFRRSIICSLGGGGYTTVDGDDKERQEDGPNQLKEGGDVVDTTGDEALPEEGAQLLGKESVRGGLLLLLLASI